MHWLSNILSVVNIQQLFAEGEVIIGEYFPKITEPEANNCSFTHLSIFTQVILILFVSLSVICTKRRLVVIL